MEAGIIEATLTAFGALSDQGRIEATIIVLALIGYAAFSQKHKHDFERDVAGVLKEISDTLKRIDERTAENEKRLIQIEDRTSPRQSSDR